MSNRVEGALFALVNSALTGRSADASQIKDAISGDGAKELYRLSKEHDLAHFVGCELEKLSLLSNDEISNKFRKQHYAAVFRYKGMEFAISEIKDALCEAKIPHIPLKGSVLRYEYPEPWMRTSCDIDILVKRTDIDRACEILAQKLGYTLAHKTEHDVSYTSVGGIKVEMHFSLIEASENERIVDILKDPWQSATPAENGYTYVMDDAVFYFYHVAHMLKHFLYGGCGIRTFVDLYVLDSMQGVDLKKRDDLLLRADILTFTEYSRALARYFVGIDGCSEAVESFASYVIAGGVYGGVETKVYIQQARRGGKFRYAMQRIFLPYKTLCLSYPIAKRHKILVPFLQVVRWFRIIFGGKVRSSAKELRSNSALDDKKAREAEDMLKLLGIDKERYSQE